jgi:hypothetical protein
MQTFRTAGALASSARPSAGALFSVLAEFDRRRPGRPAGRGLAMAFLAKDHRIRKAVAAVAPDAMHFQSPLPSASGHSYLPLCAFRRRSRLTRTCRSSHLRAASRVVKLLPLWMRPDSHFSRCSRSRRSKAPAMPACHMVLPVLEQYLRVYLRSVIVSPLSASPAGCGWVCSDGGDASRAAVSPHPG